PPRRRPPDRLWIPPPFVADRDPERDTVHLEQPALPVRDVMGGFLQRNLVLGLVAHYLAVPPDDEGGVVEAERRFPLHAHHHSHAVLPGRGTHLRQGGLLPCLVRFGHRELKTAQAGEVRFGEADDGNILR